MNDYTKAMWLVFGTVFVAMIVLITVSCAIYVLTGN